MIIYLKGSFCLTHSLNPQQAKKCLVTSRMFNSLLNQLTYYWTSGFWFSSVESTEIPKIKRKSEQDKNGTSDLPLLLVKSVWPVRTPICLKVNSSLTNKTRLNRILTPQLKYSSKPFLYKHIIILLSSVLLPWVSVNHKMLKGSKFENKETNTIKQNFHHWFQLFC